MKVLTTPYEVYRRAIKDALGFPAIMLLASMTGFGSLARESGFSLNMALSATAGIWGLPGQVAMVELHNASLPALFIILAVSLANARFLPMAVSFIPLMRSGLRHFSWMYLLVQLLSINSWVAGLKAFPEITEQLRVRYYITFALICITAGLIGTMIGFLGVTALNRPAALGLIFLNPLFFAVILAVTKSKPAVIALLFGIPLGPLFHLASPEWGLLFTGITGGTLAFLVCRQQTPNTSN